ncbi:putative Na+/H+ antiporter [Chlamydia vaughanii]|uniref:putative Na+/H+ antiporter n=1 Tax=Chlamydia vaughanii TaxID=3112552 RepID=UPI0032B21690
MILPQYSSSLKTGAAILFFCSILHTFLTPWLYSQCQLCQHKKMIFPERWKKYLWLSEFYRLVSRVELVFVLWAAPLFLWFLYSEGYKVTMGYFNSRNYVFSLFIVIMLILLESRPIVYFSERIFSNIAKIGRQSPRCWWWTLMIACPLSSIFLKETGAMIIAATLLARNFYKFSPSPRFAYATMGLLFSNISIGGLTSGLSSRALFIILPSVRWGNSFILKYFCWKSIIAMLISTTIYYLIFRKEFDNFPKVVTNPSMMNERVPKWIICVHIILVGSVIFARSIPLLMAAILIFYLGFQKFTIFYQHSIRTAKVCFVGLFYAGLVIFGELQEWWVLEIMHRMSDFGYLITSYTLSIFLDNALVNYLVHNLPVATDCFLYLVIAGCMSAGGLTIISNMPNIVGYLIIRPTFPSSSVSLGWLFLSALGPSIISLMTFWILKDVPEFLYCFFR